MIRVTQRDRTIWLGLPPDHRGSVRLQCTVQMSAITSCPPALSADAKNRAAQPSRGFEVKPSGDTVHRIMRISIRFCRCGGT